MDLFDWIKSSTAGSREQWEKNGHDRIRAHIMKDRLEEILETPCCTFLSVKDFGRFQFFLERIIAEVDQFSPLSFDVSGIDRIILGITEIMKYARANGGSRQTLEYCLTGIAYGVGPGHKEIPPQVDVSDETARREIMLDRYRDAALLSMEIDNCRLAIAKRRAERRKKKEALNALQEGLDLQIAEKPAAYEKVMGMTPQERETLTGEEGVLASGLKSCEDESRKLAQMKEEIDKALEELKELQTSLEDISVHLEEMAKEEEESWTGQPSTEMELPCSKENEGAPDRRLSEEGIQYLEQVMQKESRFYDSPEDLSENVAVMEIKARKNGKGNLPGWKMGDIHRYVKDHWDDYR
ncbi:MAG: hypothetical protein Q4D81_05690 [Eubacteriales bacterium]|nr:hypothetical protein [Eubacteriales bacterium]